MNTAELPLAIGPLHGTSLPDGVHEKPAAGVIETRLVPGGMVSEEDWNRFVQNEITPRFPAGLTVVNAYGQWRGASGNVESEPSHLVIIFHVDDSQSNSRLEEIRSRYCAEFKQESVLRADEPTVVSFTTKSEPTR